jgi:DNA-binding transcriptional LysR family regulator
VPPQSIFAHAIRDRLHLVRSEALELRTPSSSRTPPQDLQAHNCIRLRFPSGAFLPWRSSIEGKTLELDVNGSLIANDADLLVHVALNGTGVVYVLRDFAAPFIATGQLVPLLEEWMPPPSDGFFLYYPSRRQNLASLRAFIEFLLANLKKNAGSANSVDAAMQQ